MPAEATRLPLERMAWAPRMTLLTRDMIAKVAESGITITVIPDAVRVLLNVSVERASSWVDL